MTLTPPKTWGFFIDSNIYLGYNLHMTTYRETVKSALLNYPTLFSNKLSVNSHLFAVIGNGYEWTKDGNLEQNYNDPREKIGNTMWFEDLDKREKDIKERHHSLITLTAAEIESIRIMRQFTEKHIDVLLDASCSHSFFSNSAGNYRLCVYMKPDRVSYLYAKVFNYPENIQKDWATAMEDFIDVWLVGLNYEYGVSADRDLEKAVKHWPDNAKTLRTRLLSVQEDLLTKITGKNTATRRAETKALVDKIMADLAKED